MIANRAENSNVRLPPDLESGIMETQEGGMDMPEQDCDTCYYNDFDEELNCEVCRMELDQDDVYHLQRDGRPCPWYKPGDEYTAARKLK